MSSGRGAGGSRSSSSRGRKRKGRAHPKPPKRVPATKKPAPLPKNKRAPKTGKRSGRARLDFGGGSGLSAMARVVRTLGKAASGRKDGGDDSGSH